ncbi:MAG: hypothetical protein U9N77_15155 [Thermodesulfobacteriota bacterium]|nr:hypothetical protein [Thermodesulfobacteriota bacterium]
MPTLEERNAESTIELKERLEARSQEHGITYSFSEYIEMLETYLLKLERRVIQLENSHRLNGQEVMLDQKDRKV